MSELISEDRKSDKHVLTPGYILVLQKQQQRLV